MNTATLPEPAIQGAPGDAGALNALLRGELSAAESYGQALRKFEGNDTANVIPELSRIRREHLAAASTLRDRVRAMGGTPDEGSGAWGVFVAAVTGMAKVLGPETVLSALHRGEEHGIKEYEDVLQDDTVSVECKYLIRNELEPPCREHAKTLEGLIATVNESQSQSK